MYNDGAGHVQLNTPLTLASALYPGLLSGSPYYQTNCGLWSGSGAPSNAQGGNGDIYFRQDGGAGTAIYQKRSGAWTALV